MPTFAEKLIFLSLTEYQGGLQGCHLGSSLVVSPQAWGPAPPWQLFSRAAHSSPVAPSLWAAGAWPSSVKTHAENTQLPGGWPHHKLARWCKAIKPWTWKSVRPEFEFQLLQLSSHMAEGKLLHLPEFPHLWNGDITIASTHQGPGTGSADIAQKWFRRALGVQVRLSQQCLLLLSFRNHFLSVHVAFSGVSTERENENQS